MIERELGNIHVMMIKNTVQIVKVPAHYPIMHCYFLTTDIDECDREGAGEYPCDDDKEYCANSKGSYQCMKCDAACNKCLGEGNGMCVRCKEGYQTEEGKCIGKLMQNLEV